MLWDFIDSHAFVRLYGPVSAGTCWSKGPFLCACLCVYELLSATALKQLFSLWHFYGLSSAKIILVKALVLSPFGREDVRLSLVSVCKCPYSLMG